MEAAATARVLAALGHEGRLRIFQLLVRAGPDGLPAGEIGRQTGQLQNTTSSNLSVLSNVGLVSARRDGRSIIYAVTPARLGEVLGFLTEEFQPNESARISLFQHLLDAWSDGPPGEAEAGRNGNAA